MKIGKFLLFTITMLATFNMMAIDFKKFIEDHDVDEITMTLPNNDFVSFWESYVSNNMSFQKFLKDLNKNMGAEKETIAALSKMTKFNPRYVPYVCNYRDELSHELASLVGDASGIELCVLDDLTLNAFSTYSDEGLIVAINSGLFDAKGSSKEIIVAVLAHEYAHSWLLHLAQSEYTDNKKKRKNKLMAGLSIASEALADAVKIYTSAAYGINPNPETPDIDKYDRIIEKSIVDNLKYHYRYAREQEYEADLVAYRFMEWAGYGGENYIEMLKLLEANNYDYYMNLIEHDDDDHPLLRDRIEFLNFVKRNPDIKNKKNEKLKKKQQLYDKYANDDIYR